MKTLRSAIAAVLLFVAAPAFAQWQTPNHSVPVGRGGGIQGFGNALPGVAGQPLVSTGPTTDPAFGNIANSGFAAGAADTYKGSLNGTSVVDVPRAPCTAVNQALRYTAGVGESCGNIAVQTGYDMPINLGLSASVVGNALTINLTQANGSAPTSSNPVLVPFRSTTLTTGTVTWSTISAAQSVTIPSGASLGTSSSNVPFRIWIFEDYNGGTPEIGVATCSNPTAVFPCAAWESTLPTSTTIGGSSNSAGVLYATTGVVADAVRIIGYCEYGSGLTTAGTWASSCTTLQTFGPGVPKPGDIIQTVTPNLLSISAVASSLTSAPGTATNITASIAMESAVDLVRYFFTSSAYATGAVPAYMRLYRGSSTGIGPTMAETNNVSVPFIGYDSPGTVSSTSYTVREWISNSADSITLPQSTGLGAAGILEEIMGALDEPTNDNVNPGIFSQTG